MRVYLTNLGCKLNQAELEGLARRFRADGHQIASSLDKADLHVVNSCTVTHVAARDSRKVARRGRRLNPALRTVLTGCYVDSDPEEARSLAGVDLVVPNADKDELLDHIYLAFPDERPHSDGSGHVPVPYVPLDFGNSRALVKIEDGCNMRCSFCVIPFTRGAQRSRSVEEIEAEVAGLAAAGLQEVVLTGVQISAYKSGDRGLYDLTKHLLERTPVPRLRLTSIAPWQFDPRLLDLLASGRVCRHFHLSLQSGCDRTLERMRRPYSSADFSALVSSIRSTVPGVALTTDLIVGFPGESEAEARASLDFTREIGFARVHAFPYSLREGTEAANLSDQIPHQIKRQRMAAALEVAKESERAFLLSQLGSETQVLFERDRSGGRIGTSDNYLRVFTMSPGGLGQELEAMRLDDVHDVTAIAHAAGELPSVNSSFDGLTQLNSNLSYLREGDVSSPSPTTAEGS